MVKESVSFPTDRLVGVFSRVRRAGLPEPGGPRVLLRSYCRDVLPRRDRQMPPWLWWFYERDRDEGDQQLLRLRYGILFETSE